MDNRYLWITGITNRIGRTLCNSGKMRVTYRPTGQGELSLCLSLSVSFSLSKADGYQFKIKAGGMI